MSAAPDRIAASAQPHGMMLSLHGFTLVFPHGAIPRVYTGESPNLASEPILAPERYGQWSTLAQQRAYIRRFVAAASETAADSSTQE